MKANLKETIKSFIKARRKQAAEIRIHKSFAFQGKLNKKLREENARVMEWMCDMLEYDCPELKD